MAAVDEAPVQEQPRAKLVEAPVGQDEKAAQDAMNRMREYFASRPKVSIKTREDEWVQVNGYTFVIKAGERVDVPDDIAAILEESGRI